MDILETLVSREINTISNGPQYTIAWGWEISINANGQIIRPLFIREVKTHRLYATNYADILIFSVAFVQGDFEQSIVPFKDSLEATVIRKPYGAKPDDGEDKSQQMVITNYSAQLVDGGKSKVVDGDDPFGINIGMSYRGPISEVQIQIYNPVIDYIRKQQFSHNFRQCTLADAIRVVLAKYTKPESADKNFDIRGVDMKDPPESPILEQIPIKPQPIINVPHYLNEMYSGVYPLGFGYYLQAGIWYVFQPFDVKSFDSGKRTLTIIKIPQHRMRSVEKSYRVTPTQVIVLITGNSQYSDNSESNQLNTGNGFMFADADKLHDSSVEQIGNKARVSANKNIVDVTQGTRADGDNAPVTSTPVSNDYYLEYSELARKSGGVLQAVWDNGNINLLYPGMPVRYIFMNGDKYTERYGNLNGSESIDYRPSKNPGEARFQSSVLMTVFTERMSTDQPVNEKSIKRNKTLT